MVNTYNPEWISAWNGNMDIQLCFDFFAVITYISDYYSKDDSGIMKLLIDSVKDDENEDLIKQLRNVESVFLTHRQIGESEAFYRLLSHMHLKESNIEAVFAPTGFNPSHFLQRLDDDIAEKCENAIEVEGREGKYEEKASLYDKYLKRDCDLQPELKDLCFAQFVKRYTGASKGPNNNNFTQEKVRKTCNDQGIFEYGNFIITKNIDQENFVFKLPTYIALKNVQDHERPFMKIRTEAVLRFHKFKKDKQPHEYQFSELQLYYPHTNNPKDGQIYSLELEKDDPDICQETYLSSDIHIVKSKIMPFLVAVEEGIEAAHELNNTVGNDLDPQNEQDCLECQDIGLEDNPDFLA
jgi:hypothetical protein